MDRAPIFSAENTFRAIEDQTLPRQQDPFLSHFFLISGVWDTLERIAIDHAALGDNPASCLARVDNSHRRAHYPAQGTLTRMLPRDVTSG